MNFSCDKMAPSSRPGAFTECASASAAAARTPGCGSFSSVISVGIVETDSSRPSAIAAARRTRMFGERGATSNNSCRSRISLWDSVWEGQVQKRRSSAAQKTFTTVAGISGIVT